MGIATRVLNPLYETGMIYGIRDAARATALLPLSYYPTGTNVYDKEWDLLVVLDTCRVDALRAVAPEYEFLDEIASIWSVGSATRTWVANTFTPEYVDEVNETVWVSANGTEQHVFEWESPELYGELPFQGLYGWDVVDESDFKHLDQPWKHVHDNPLSHLTLPGTITDRAVRVGRRMDAERMIVMYKQPHAPYCANALAEDRDLEPHEADPWQALRDGVPRSTVWEAYLDELRYGLDHVETLLRNVDAETVAITADHGECFGEYGIYSHPAGVPVPPLRRVPWATTTATDSGEYEPEIELPDDDGVSRSVEDQLESLGYKV
jgi:hypothetical protein